MASSKSKRSRRNSKNGRFSLHWPFVVVAVAIFVSLFWNNNDESGIVVSKVDNAGCGVIMAPSALSNNAGWGVFTLRNLQLGDPATDGEIVIQLTNPLAEYTADFHVLLEHYSWLSNNGGGTFEADSVYSLMPGIGALANGHPKLFNIAATLPQLSNAGVTRTTSPGAGASTHYHNLKWHARKPLRPGDELLINYGPKWEAKLDFGNPDRLPTRPVKELRDTGICLDNNIRPGNSTLPHATRGAFANRNIRKGYVIAPVPLIVIPRRQILTTRRIVEDPITHRRSQVFQEQLLLNYCYGHSNSSLLFFPYSSMVNLINHNSQRHANAKLQWSQSKHLFGNHRDWLEWPFERIQSLKRTGLLMEIVATKDIQEGQEIFLNYGPEWETAWNQHVANWKPPKDDDNRKYSYPFEIDLTKTDPIAIQDSLTDNVLMVCNYTPFDTSFTVSSLDVNGEEKKVVQWQPTLTSVTTFQPCRILHHDRDDTENLFTIHLLDDDYVVTKVPRNAIALRDKKYVSDQHLDNAFRHEIGIPDDVFPKQWMNLAK